MKYIILCGGIDKQPTSSSSQHSQATHLPSRSQATQQASLPSPLNYIQGRHMIEYVIDNIPSNEVYIIYNIFLDEYNFQEILINKCKSKRLFFSQIEYQTRGAVETAFVGINKFIDGVGEDKITYDDKITFCDNIVFIDNDNLHNLTKPIPVFENDFLGYSILYMRSILSTHNASQASLLSQASQASQASPQQFSFIRFEGDRITHIEEKNQISSFNCSGFYGFKNVKTFLKYAKMLFLRLDDNTKDIYFSALYNIIIESGVKVEPFFIEETTHLGILKDIRGNNIIPKNKLRICFDLDNTLVSYPTIAGDYSTVKPIAHNISLLKKLRDDGHEIIIYTARRMKTHGGNVGKVIKDIAGITIDTLERFNIEYDELIFGKPIADIYIDDRAINPFINDLSYFGLYYDTNSNTSQFIPNKIKNNKYNKIKRCDEYIVKTGPLNILKGELYYYQNIPSGFENYFPKLVDYKKYEDTIDLKIEYVEGIPLYYLYKNCLLTYRHIDDLFDILDRLHHSQRDDIMITRDNIKNNYINKLKNRFNKQDYYFEDADDVFLDIIADIETHFNPTISQVIHGDFWFSNIILTYEGGYKLIDMKGAIDNILTLNGDIYYDYGKLYQSILGYDLVLNGSSEASECSTEYIQTMKAYFLKKCVAKGLDINYLKSTTKGLVFGTMPFISHYSKDIKNNIWKLIKSPLMNAVSGVAYI